jgi:hypothetical protein
MNKTIFFLLDHTRKIRKRLKTDGTLTSLLTEGKFFDKLSLKKSISGEDLLNSLFYTLKEQKPIMFLKKIPRKYKITIQWGHIIGSYQFSCGRVVVGKGKEYIQLSIHWVQLTSTKKSTPVTGLKVQLVEKPKNLAIFADFCILSSAMD